MVNCTPQIGDLRPANDAAPVEWRRFDGAVDYACALLAMDRQVAAIAGGGGAECVWLLEHPPLYTAGTSARDEDLVDPDRFPVFRAGRGGQYTYHGPGQRVAYVMLDLKRRNPDVRGFVHGLEEWLIRALAAFQVAGERRQGRVGIWVQRPEKGAGAEDKIAAIGVRLRRWISLHGVSLNVMPDLEHYAGIVPCGIREHGATSLADLKVPATMEEVDRALWSAFGGIFGPSGAICSAAPGILDLPAPVPLRPRS